MTATIPLAQTYKGKIPAHAFVSEKIDGVPIKFTCHGDGIIAAETRAGKAGVQSIDHIRKELRGIMQAGDVVVMEVFMPGVPFKVSSGCVRRDKPNVKLLGAIFDFWTGKLGYGFPFSTRLGTFSPKYQNMKNAFVVKQYEISDEAGLRLAQDHILAQSPTPPEFFEGWVLRDAMAHSCPGSRSTGYWRITEDPTVDLKAVGVFEAFDKQGDPKNMAGGLIVERRDGTYNKISAGKLTHGERVALFAGAQMLPESGGVEGETDAYQWYLFRDGKTPLMQAKYKRDPSYHLLRQATFQHWRTDKDEPSED